MRRFIFFAVFPFFACGLENVANQIQSTNLVAATLISVPPSDYTPPGGTKQTVPGAVEASVFFGSRQADKLDAPPAGIAGATVNVKFGTVTVALADKGQGTYAVTSVDKPELVYTASTEYTFEVVNGGQTYTGKVTPAAPEVVNVTAPVAQPQPLDPTQLIGPSPSPATSGVTLQRTAAATDGGKMPIAFTTVFPLDNTGKKGQPSYTNAPKDAMGLLQLVADDTQWRVATVSIPGSAFPTAKTGYVIAVTDLKKGTVSNNLFLGSAVLAGSAAAGVAITP